MIGKVHHVTAEDTIAISVTESSTITFAQLVAAVVQEPSIPDEYKMGVIGFFLGHIEALTEGFQNIADIEIPPEVLEQIPQIAEYIQMAIDLAELLPK